MVVMLIKTTTLAAAARKFELCERRSSCIEMTLPAALAVVDCLPFCCRSSV